MKKILKLFSAVTVFSFISFAFAIPTYAVCPVCTVAVVAGLGLSRFLGIDDTVSGLWIGGVILSTSFWFAGWIWKKFENTLKHKGVVTVATIISMYALTLLPLQLTGILGHPFNVLWGVDKLILGIIVGSIIFLLAMFADKKVREIKGHQLFSFQRVIFPVVTLLIASIVFFLITKR